MLTFIEIKKIFYKLRPKELDRTELHLAPSVDFPTTRDLSFCTIEKYPQIYISANLGKFSVSNIKAVLMHEFGHALYISKNKNHSEHQADILAGKIYKKKIYYDSRDIQTLRKTKKTKRPLHLHQ